MECDNIIGIINYNRKDKTKYNINVLDKFFFGIVHYEISVLFSTVQLRVVLMA